MQNVSRAANSRVHATSILSRIMSSRQRVSCVIEFSTGSTSLKDGPSSVKTITKKTFTELPRIQTEKTVVLPPWDGGLKSKVLIEGPSSIAVLDNISNPEQPSAKRTRRNQKSKNGEVKIGCSHEPPNPSTIDSEFDYQTTEHQEPTTNKREPRKQLAEEIKGNLARFPGCILLTRVGQFYESVFDQAQEVASLLSIKLAKRTYKEGAVWLCGFPLSHLDKHLRTLVEKHRRSVALCEEFVKHRGTATSKPLFERRVVRILTPGTLIDESFLNPYANNFLLTISAPKDDLLGIAWIDVSTGEFSSLETSTTTLVDHLVRINPREVVLDDTMNGDLANSVKIALMEENATISYLSANRRIENTAGVEPSISIENAEGMSEKEGEATALLTQYLRDHLLEHTPESLRYSRDELVDVMHIDAHTTKALEIKENLTDGGSYGSVMSTIKRTVTSSGTRLLSRRLCSPSTSIVDLTARQDLVEIFHRLPWLRQDVIQCLKRTGDAAKILQRFSLGRGDIDDLLQIKQTIANWNVIRQKILSERVTSLSGERDGVPEQTWASLEKLLGQMADLTDIAERIEFAIEGYQITDENSSDKDEDDQTEAENALLSPGPGLSTSDTRLRLAAILAGDTIVWRMKPQFSEELNQLHGRLLYLQFERNTLEKRFKEQYDAPSLSLRYSPSQGLYVHLARLRRDADRISKSHVFHKISESGSTGSYFNEEWTRLGGAIIEVVIAICSAEKNVFTELRLEVTSEAPAIRRTARIVDELDVTSAFATLAAEMNFVRPSFTTSNTIEITEGRHPTVEVGLLNSGRSFTSNSLSMDESSRLHVITGPNMAGKSTYLRQIALITILAQTGSFVPAKMAELGIVDRVFSRVGAKDDLFRDRSTFMVEMLETANILKNATSKSLVIMDEVGRGTTMVDGISIAFAVICHLYFKNRCRTLFATHFHEVIDMLGASSDGTEAGKFPGIRYYCTDVDEVDGRFAYSHIVRPGVNRHSHGLKVAQLGGMPPYAMQIASKTLSSILDKQISPFSKATSCQLSNIGEETLRCISDPDIEIV